jgi:PhzF family phenazine biosynthesis protein
MVSPSPIPITHVDAFTATPFGGNPAAVCLLPGARPDTWMQNVAREMNLSETAFLHPSGDGYNLRWFAPSAEVDLCGHATLASAHVLWEEGHLAPEQPARFHTKSGVLSAKRRGEWIEMDFPATPDEPDAIPLELAEGLHVTPKYVGRSKFDFLAELESEEAVRKIQPDLALLRLLHCRGVIVTSRASTGGYDFISRFFAPAIGVDEDPVTGSAHSCLGPFWSKRLGKTELLAYQASARGGVVRVRMNGDRVLLGGQAVTVLRGQLQAQ